MNYPMPMYSDQIQKSRQTKFGGMNHNPGAGDGELYRMQNLCSDYYPLLSTRQKRRTLSTVLSRGANGLASAGGKLIWIDGEDPYYDGNMMGIMFLDQESHRSIAAIGKYVVIAPDMVVYDTEENQTEEIHKEYTNGGTASAFSFADGTLYGVSASANTLRCNGSGFSWLNYFRAGDAIEISGAANSKNNISAIIREISATELRFYENTFVNGNAGSFTIQRKTPRLNYLFECENRIWGCDDSTIYCCKPGDPFNWFCYDGLETDSWAAETSSSGVFTGAVCYMGYPTFFKDRGIYKVYGSVPSNYELMGSATLGVAEGSGRSLAVAGEMLFYHSDNGICMYTGGLPTAIGRAFGLTRYRDAVGGSDGLKYYVSMQDEANAWHLFVYDTQRGMWHEEDQTQVVDFAWAKGNLYYLDADGHIRMTGNLFQTPGDATEEEDFDWYAEFTDFTDDSPNKKGISKIQIRLELEEGASCTVKLMLDSTGEWITPQDGTIQEDGKRSYYLAIIPQRADHYRMRLEGHGGCRVYSIAREYYIGSELKSQPGRQ